MPDFDNMTGKMSMAEFNSLARYEDGSIEDLGLAQIFMTDEQRDLVGDDDFSRLEVNDEEMRYMLAEEGII